MLSYVKGSLNRNYISTVYVSPEGLRTDLTVVTEILELQVVE